MGALSGALATGLVATDASAGEPFPTRAERVMAPGRSMATEDSAEAVVLNPANLGFMNGREARWTFVRCPDTQHIGCGHSFDLATKLPWNLATAFRVDLVQPPGGPDGVGFPYDGTDYVWLTWGLAKKFNDEWSVGATTQWSYSTNTYTNGLFGLTAGVSYRPYSLFAFGLTLNDFNGPSTKHLPPLGYPVLDRSYALAAAFRPTGTRAAELGLELRYFEGQDRIRPRATLGIDIPGVGRARGDVEVQELANDSRRGVMATAGLEVNFNKFSVGGGALFGNGLGTSQSVGEYASVSVSNVLQPGVPRPERAVFMRVEATPGPRTHVHMLERLWKIAEDKEIALVMMEMRAEPAGSYAHAEELADAFRMLRARGKKVICSMEDGGPRALYACASANRIVGQPAGGLRYQGLKSQHYYLAGLLKKLGVRAEFIRIGAHKSAPEQFTNEHASEVARQDQEDLLRNVEAVFNRNLSLYRHIPEEKIRAATLKGPFTTKEAIEAGFMDEAAFDDQLEKVATDAVGHKVKYEKYEDETRAPEVIGGRPRLGLIYVDGDIVDGRSKNVPLLGSKMVGSYTIAETAKKMRDDNDIKAVVLRIESPGGSAMASDVMWRELKLLNDKKPLIISMGSVAASGGYYIASAGRMIFALPLTITGSIGIFFGKADVSELMTKIGVNVDTVKTTPRADAESPYRPFTDDEKRELDHKMHQFYDVFLERVARGRHMSKEEVDAVGQGRVWAGQQALGNKLVDRMGGIRNALDAARSAGNLPDNCPIVESPEEPKTLLDQALALGGMKESLSVQLGSTLPPSIMNIARAIAPMAIYNDETPLARMEWTPLDEMEGTDADE
jgi:protease-4